MYDHVVTFTLIFDLLQGQFFCRAGDHNSLNLLVIYVVLFQRDTNNHVLAMELCSGGSVYSMLDQPKYAYGFPEEEFLIFLSDLGTQL